MRLLLDNPLRLIDPTGTVPVQTDSTSAKNGPGVVILFAVKRNEIVGRMPDGTAIAKGVTEYVKANDKIQRAANTLYDHYVDRRLEVNINIQKAVREAGRIANGSEPAPMLGAISTDLAKGTTTGKAETGNMEKEMAKDPNANIPTVDVRIGGDHDDRDLKAELELTKVLVSQDVEAKHIPGVIEAIKAKALEQGDNLWDQRKGKATQ